MSLAKIRNKATNLFQSNLARDTLWMLSSKLFNIVMQAVYFTLIARMLGDENFGSFIGITATASLVFPFASLGSEHVLVKNVSASRQTFSTYWGNSLLLLATNGTLLMIALFAVSIWRFPDINRSAIATILMADLTGLALLDLGFKSMMAVNMIHKTAQLGILSTCGKLIAALCLAAFFTQPSTADWAYLYLASSVVTAIVAVLLITKTIGSPKPRMAELKANVGQGLYFSISASANNINTSLDKSMMLDLSSQRAVGIYGVAYRFIDVGNVFLLALFGATYTRFFQHGAKGIKGSLSFAKKLLPIIIAFAVASVVGNRLIAPYIPLIFGEQFSEAIGALMLLSPLPAIAAFQYLAADSLTGSGHQKARSIVQVGAAVINIVLNLYLIPRYSWRGAAYATLIADSLRLVCLWFIVFYLYRRESS